MNIGDSLNDEPQLPSPKTVQRADINSRIENVIWKQVSGIDEPEKCLHCKGEHILHAYAVRIVQWSAEHLNALYLSDSHQP